ncbi:hypothetical protein BLA29_008192 [Euroglyphus maynei]|uniref:Uncharacterized protein n=1 Tax=Euroglyphus maynei TaxID=6958 RepID=A0A1Y3BHQ4_EURMA|nr:hypothetical protein BLA29_008192 [Euroglyphus maynei]
MTTSEAMNEPNIKLETDSIQQSPVIKMDEKATMIISVIDKPIESTKNPDTSANILISVDNDKAKVHSVKNIINAIDSPLKSKMIINKTNVSIKTNQKSEHSKMKNSQKEINNNHLLSKQSNNMNNVGKIIASITMNKHSAVSRSAAVAIPSPIRKSMIPKVDTLKTKNKIESILSKHHQQQQQSLKSKKIMTENSSKVQRQKSNNRKSIVTPDNDHKLKSPEILSFSPGLVTPDANCMGQQQSESPTSFP